MDLTDQAQRLAEYDRGLPDRDLRVIGRKVRKRMAANAAVQPLSARHAELWAVANFFDAVECGRLIALIDRSARPSTSHSPEGDAVVRTSHSGDFDPNDPFVMAMERRIDELLGLDPATGELLQGQRYTAGQYFLPHIDWFAPSSPGWLREREYGGQRAITAMAYLNDVGHGGETDFPELDMAIAPQAGALLVWNNADADGLPNPYTVHAGNPVTRGVKYVVTKWYRCGDSRRPG